MPSADVSARVAWSDDAPAIAAVHSDAPTAAATDWAQVVALYDQLLIVAPSPVVALNRAVAVARTDNAAERALPRRNLERCY